MTYERVKKKLITHLDLIYPDLDQNALADDIIHTFWPKTAEDTPREDDKDPTSYWSEEDALMITYGDSLLKTDEAPLKTLQHFLHTHIEGAVNGVHILPFFPFSSDDGFAVMDYEQVREDLGGWDDIKAIGDDYKLMSDIVINHASSRGSWFQGFLEGTDSYKDFFVTASPEDDLSRVVRPRPTPLLTGFDTSEGLQHLWCTFGPDQVDLNFSNPRVLIEFVKIIRLYIDYNVRIFRMDAVAFLWKEIGTECIHLPQTHEIIRLFRTLADFYQDNILIITETNVPNHENLSYFGNQNEAHLIYNFTLPPLVIQALLTGSEYYLKRWLMGMPPTQFGCTYFNFTASHDGIGLRPATGILLEEDLQEMIRTIRSFGGEISMRTSEDGEQRPYEINTSLYDALKGTIYGEDDLQRERFLASQTIMMSLEGIPAFYIHSLLATPNDVEKFRASGHKRGINRHQWDYEHLENLLSDPHSDQSYIFSELKRLIHLRKQNPCFHPNAIQFTLHLPNGFFGFWRKSLNRTQSTFCITNLTKDDLALPLHDLNLHSGVCWYDVITDEEFHDLDRDLILFPYQSMWITHK